jgi:hypothetical protein
MDPSSTSWALLFCNANAVSTRAKALAQQRPSLVGQAGHRGVHPRSRCRMAIMPPARAAPSRTAVDGEARCNVSRPLLNEAKCEPPHIFLARPGLSLRHQKQRFFYAAFSPEYHKVPIEEGQMDELLKKFGIDPTIAYIIVAALVYLIASAILVFRRTDDKARVAVITFVGVPLILAILILAVIFFPPVAHVFIRCVFIFFAIMIPASLFFLFIATRREGLFNAYTANLDRAGLLRPRRLLPDPNDNSKTILVESESSRRRRIKSYLDRFGAAYGALQPEFIEKFLRATAGSGAAEEVSLLSSSDTSFDLKTVLPIIGATVLITLGWVTTLPVGIDIPETLKSLGEPYGFKWFNTLVLPVFSPVNFAFLGAYFFSLQMLVRRFVRRDLGPNAYNAVSLRILLATLGVWVVAQGIGESSRSKEFLVVAFAIGAFPDIVWQFVAGAVKKLPIVGWALPNLKTGIPLNVVDGLTVWHEARLEEEDIENVPNLATADVVDLFLNTKFPPHRIIDWIDQAILLVHLCDDTQGAAATASLSYQKLKGFGLRTATTFVQAWEIAAEDRPDGNVLFKGFELEFTDMQKHQFSAVAGAIRSHPNFPIVLTWRGMHDDPQSSWMRDEVSYTRKLVTA